MISSNSDEDVFVLSVRFPELPSHCPKQYLSHLPLTSCQDYVHLLCWPIMPVNKDAVSAIYHSSYYTYSSYSLPRQVACFFSIVIFWHWSFLEMSILLYIPTSTLIFLCWRRLIEKCNVIRYDRAMMGECLRRSRVFRNFGSYFGGSVFESEPGNRYCPKYRSWCSSVSKAHAWPLSYSRLRPFRCQFQFSLHKKT
jgi:hypothetical protein